VFAGDHGAENVHMANGAPSPRILVVDDVDGSRDMISELLEMYGLNVVGQAENGEQAIEMALELEPDVVLMDVRMKGIDGLEATRRLKRLQPGVRVITLSVFEDEDVLAQGREAGADGHLTKGTPGPEFRERVLEVCGIPIDSRQE
jgi:two-component system, NarL family, invasion response regulator UvrY